MSLTHILINLTFFLCICGVRSACLTSSNSVTTCLSRTDRLICSTLDVTRQKYAFVYTHLGSFSLLRGLSGRSVGYEVAKCAMDLIRSLIHVLLFNCFVFLLFALGLPPERGGGVGTPLCDLNGDVRPDRV